MWGFTQNMDSCAGLKLMKVSIKYIKHVDLYLVIQTLNLSIQTSLKEVPAMMTVGVPVLMSREGKVKFLNNDYRSNYVCLQSHSSYTFCNYA